VSEIAPEAVAAGAAALHEAECADELCWREGHENYRSQPNEEITRTVLEAAAPLIAAAERERIRQLAITEADRLRGGNFGPRTADVKALHDFADLLDGDGNG
jgi:hypothetical protein